ncbi:uncharacterized protein LOC135134189 [Zophobas morio]|uniref:uncharacterized protein LOC135134189 n=1 Tax=Zophobas morio TaxID=2755281 RepID=UPI003083CF40
MSKLIGFLVVIVGVQVAASSWEFYKGPVASYGGVNNNGDIGVRGSDGSLRQETYYYLYPNFINPLGGVDNNGKVGVRRSDGSLRQGDGRYASAYGDGNNAMKKPSKKGKLKNKTK